MANQTLTDKFGRKHDYLRISLIERCNLRCHYCMPEEGIELRDKGEFMSQEELFQITDTFLDFGIKKIRLSGGEPLIKKNIAAILSHLGKKNIELTITTNGVLLDRYWSELKDAGVHTLNISIDSLNKEKFNAISRRDFFDRVYANIFNAVDKGFKVKLNTVLMRGENDCEILDFIRLTENNPFNIRFIEFMPFDGNKWQWDKKVPYKEILNLIKYHYGNRLIEMGMEKNGTSRNFQISGFKGSFGIISSVTNPFCDTCNRIRLTADGKIKNCLFSESETDLLTALRNQEDISSLIINSIQNKQKERGGLADFDDPDFKSENRSMIAIGG